MSDDKTLSVQRNKFLATLQGDSFKKQMALAMPKHMTADRMLRVALTAMNKTPDLFECDPNTVMACMMDCSALGLEPDGRKAYLIPFKDNKNNRKVCTLIIGYQGMIELAYRHPLVKGIRAKAVYDEDHFVYDEGLHPRLEHTPTDKDNPGRLKYAYAICQIGDGGSAFVVVNRRQVMKAKAFSRGSDRGSSPWQTNEEAMWVKTAIRALSKFMPSSVELSQAIDIDDRETMIDQGALSSIPAGQIGAGTVNTLMQQAASERDAKAAGNPSDPATPADGTAAGEAGKPADGAATTPAGPTPKEMLDALLSKGATINAGAEKIRKALVSLRMIEPSDKLEKLPAGKLADLIEVWDQIAEHIGEAPQ